MLTLHIFLYLFIGFSQYINMSLFPLKNDPSTRQLFSVLFWPINMLLETWLTIRSEWKYAHGG